MRCSSVPIRAPGRDCERSQLHGAALAAAATGAARDALQPGCRLVDLAHGDPTGGHRIVGCERR
eukprot:3077757-Prymnesium_polylepis.1